MAKLEGTQKTLRRFGLPTLAGALGAGTGLLLTRKNKSGGGMPNLGDLQIGDLADDLRERVQTVFHKAEPSSRAKSASNSSGGRRLDRDELDRRLQERQERRSNRRARS